MAFGNIDIFSRRGQEVIMVLYALRELGGIRTKEEVLRFIRQNRFYELLPEDRESYDGKREWKSDTLLCFARKDAVENDLMFDHDKKDEWEITRAGLEALSKVIGRFRTQQYAVQRCFMWRPEFKKIIDSTHSPSSSDHVRRSGGQHTTLVDRALALLATMGKERDSHPKI